MFDDRHGLAGEDGLVNAEGSRADLDEPEVRGDLVTDCGGMGN